MPRLQVDPGIRVPTIRPIATPVDTFVRPEQDGKLDQLSAALSRVSPQIKDFAGNLGQQIDANAEEQGRQAAEKIRTEGLTLAEATRKGVIPASKNPFYMAGLREQIGRNMADKFDGDLRAAMGNDENLQVSTDIKDFDAFAQKFQTEWSKNNIGETDQDQHFTKGYLFRADAYLTQARNNFANGIEEKVKTQADEATFSEVYKHVEDNMGKLSPDAIATDINNLTNDLIQKQGRNGRQVMQTVAKAITSAALNNPERGLAMLDLMKSVKGPFGTLASTSYGSALIKQARDEVNNQKWQATQREHEKQDQDRKDRTRDVLSQAVKDLVSNPRAPLTKYVGQLQDVPEAVESLTALQNHITSWQDVVSDQPTKRDLFSRIYTVNSGPGYVTAPTVVKMMNSGKLSVTDANFLIDRIQERDRSNLENDPLKKAAQDPDFTAAISNIDAMFDKPLTGIVSGERGSRIANAEAELRYSWYQLHDSGEADKMTREKRVEWLTKEAQRIHDRDPGHISMSKAAAPEFGKKESKPAEPPKTAVLTRDDLVKYAGGTITSNLRMQMRAYKLTTETLPSFISSQTDLVYQKKETKPKP